MKLTLFMGRFSGKVTAACLGELGFTGDNYNIKIVDKVEFGLLLWALSCREYIKMRKSGFPAAAIRYEDLVNDRRFALEAVLEYCGLPLSLMEKALRGFELDSQRHSPLSQKILKKYQEAELTPGAIERADVIMKKYGLPLIRDEGILEGTITYRKI